MLTSLASARPGHGRGGPGPFPLRVLQHLDLSETQQTNIEVIRAAHQENLSGLKSDLKEARQEVMDQLLGETDVVAGDFATLQADLNQIRAALFDELLAMGLEIRAELTPEQLVEAAALVEEIRQRRAERRAAAADGN